VFAVTAAGDSLPSNVRIAAATTAGDSAASAAVTVLMPPTAPTGVTVTNPTVSSLQVNWPAAPAAQAVTGYLVSTNGAAPVAAASPDVVTGLAANTTYGFTVAAVNATATSAASAPARGLTLPAAPSALTVGTVTGTSVALSWTAPANATSLQYVVQVVPAAGTVTYTGTTAVVSGLAPTTSYTFTVVASNVSAAAAAAVGGGGLSAPSNAVTAQTLAGAPTGLNVTATAATSVSLSWTAPANSVGITYRVNVTPATGTAAITGTTAVVSGLASNASYSFTVAAVNSAAVASPPSNSVTALTLPGTSGTPVVGAITSSSVALTWAAPAGGAASYIVQYSTTAAFTPTTSFSQPAPTTGVTVTGLAPSTTYYFRIVAANATGNGAASAAVQATTAAGVPQAPTGLVFSNVSATTITASWTAVAGATSYDATVTPGGLGNVGTQTRALTGLAGNTSYAFSIRSRNAAGASVAALTGTQLTLPAAPGTPVVGAITSSSVALSWAAPLNGATGYSVQYSTNGFATFVTTSVAAGTNTTVTGLASATAFSFRVVAVNATGSSLPSGTANASTSAVAGGVAPTPTVTAVTTTNVTLSWPAVAGATGYTLYRNGAVAWSGTNTTVNQAGQVAGNTYSFTLAVTTAAGLSAQSAAVSATTLPLQPVAPTVSVAGNTAANHLVTVTVAAKPATETAAITYTIRYQYRAGGGGTPWGAVTVIRTGITATGAAQAIALNMPAAGRYRFSIVAVDAGGSSTASPNSATARSQ
jgi:chitodextrinase